MLVSLLNLPPSGDWKHLNPLNYKFTMRLIHPIPHPDFHPVIFLPDEIELYDFSQGYDPNRQLLSHFGVGKYNEHRPNMYKGDLFEQDARTVHVGIDIGCPAETPIHAFETGRIVHQGYNPEPFDYGHVMVTEHQQINGQTVWVLWGHLSKKSISRRTIGTSFEKGDILGWVGDKSENGGWNPHLHIQLSRTCPDTHDMPGVVSLKNRAQALFQYPDPRIVLGQIYQ